MPAPSLLAPATTPNTGLERKLQDNNTVILSDTLHFETLSTHNFCGSMLNPTTLLQEIITGHLDYYVWVATKKVLDVYLKEKATSMRQDHVVLAVEHLFTELACAIGDRVEGPHIAFVDPRAHGDTRALVVHAHRLRGMLIQKGIAKRNIVVSIPATDAGILAALELEKQEVHVNLYLVSSIMHAAACVEAKAATISIPVGPLLSWYEKRWPSSTRTLDHHPGVETIQAILAYFKLNKINIKVLGTSFRNLTEIGLLSECDAVCVSEKQAEKLRWSNVPTVSLEDKDLPAVLRASQAKYPTDLLSKGDGFTKNLSADSRILTTKFLCESLENLGEAMDTIEFLVSQELEHKINIFTPSMRRAYRNRTPENKSEGYRTSK